MKTIYGANRLQRIQYGNYSTTIPATWYYALHKLNELVGAVSIGATTITVLRIAAADGAKCILEPGTANAEEVTISAVDGVGPYNLTVTALTKNHADTVEVLTDPGFTAEAVSEFSGGSYARASHTNNSTNYADAASGQSSNLTVITFPTLSSSLGKASHLLQYDASSGGNAWEWWRLATAIDLVSGEAPKVNIGQKISFLRGATA